MLPPSRSTSGRRRIRALLLAALGAAWLAPAPALAQNAVAAQGSTPPAHPFGHSSAVPSATAFSAASPVVLDGRLDDAAWGAASPISDFTQNDPEEGKPASQRTEVRFLFDGSALYVGARMFEREGPSVITTRLVRRDADMASDWFQVVIDAYHDHLGRAFFQVNPSGAKYDALGVGASFPDESWDGIWEAATHIDSLGWTAELRIPFSQLRFSRDSLQTWGLQVRRWIQRRQEEDQWSFWRKTDPGGPSRFGHLAGVRILASPRHLELVPYAVARSRFIRPASPGDPFNDGSVQDWRVGGDAKYLVGSNLTLDLTVNPDFGQVEVDPAVVNLTAFETFYQEKRPFFVEGAGIFDFGPGSCFFCSNFSTVESFYSRRIGRAPQAADLAYALGGHVDMPENSTILGAAKVTGRTGGGYTLGLMNAVTRREVARIDTGGFPRVKAEVEPFTNYLVGRVKRDFMNGNLIVGAIGTSVVRDLDEQALADRLTHHAEMVGGDMLLTWAKRTYSLMGSVALSNVHGDTAAILRLQNAPARYLGRPDRGTRGNGFLTERFDPTLRSMRGVAGYARLAKDAGSWLWEAQVNGRSSGWEVNDLSFLQRADYVSHIANVYRYWSRPTSWYRQLNFIVGGQEQWNLDGTLTDRDGHLYLGGQTPGFWQWSSFVILKPELRDDQLLRGGPIVKKPGTGLLSAQLSTDSRRPIGFSQSQQYSWNFEGGHGITINSTVRYRPTSTVQLQFGPSYQASTSLLQYVTSVDDPTATEFFGRRYVLSNLRRRQLSLDTRLNVTWTPTMTLELYAQPFVASGHFYAYKEFDARGTNEKSVYGRDRGTVTAEQNERGVDTAYVVDPDGGGPAASFRLRNPDFALRSLRGNAVFRWEYRPGSMLYLVWTQSRFDRVPYTGDLQFGRDREALFATHPDNVFLVKLSYWLGR